MADPKLPDINPELAALPYDNEVKRQIYDAFYSDNDETSKQILESLPIPGKLKNDFYERRHTSAKPAVASQTQQPPTEGIMARAEKNLPRSGANFIKGLGTAAVEAATLGAGRLTQSVKNVGQATGKALKTGGVGAAIDAGLEQGVTEAFAPILGFAKHVASRVMNPMESFAEDPVGTTVDVASVAIPALSSERGAAAINKVKGAVGIKPKSPPPPAPRGPAAESAKVFESGAKPVSRERAVRIEELKSKIKTKPTAPPPVVEKQKPLRKDQKQLPAPEKPRFVAGKDGIADTDTPPPFNPIEAEIVDPVPQTQKALPPASPAPRFYASETGEVADASRPVATPVPGQKQLPAPKTAEQQVLPAAAEQKALPAPTEGRIDYNKIVGEVNSDMTTVSNMDKLDNQQLVTLIEQYKKDPSVDFSSPDFDPVVYESARRARTTAQAILRERAATGQPGLESPINYTPDTPVPQTKFVGGEEVPVVPPRSAVITEPGPDKIPQKFHWSKKETPAPVEPKPQTVEAPVATPAPEVITPSVVPVEAPVAPPVKPVVKPSVASKPAAKPAAAPVKPKALEVAQAQVKASTPPTVKPAAKQEPVTPTVTAKAEAVEPIASPVPQALKEGDGFTEASIRNGKASYKTKSANGNIDVKPGERAFYREIDGDTDIYTVRESGGKVNVYDIEDNVVASYPKGTPAEKAMEQKFGRTVTTAQAPAPQAPTTPAKSSPIPKKKEQPVAKEVKAEETAKEVTPKTDEPPNLSREAFMEKLKELTDRIADGEDLSKAEIAEMRRLARRVEQVEVSAPVYKLKAAKGEKIMKPKISKDSAEIEVAAYDKDTGNYPIKDKYTISREGDKYVIIDKSRKRIGSYDAKTIEEAVDLALKD